MDDKVYLSLPSAGPAYCHCLIRFKGSFSGPPAAAGKPPLSESLAIIIQTLPQAVKI